MVRFHKQPQRVKCRNCKVKFCGPVLFLILAHMDSCLARMRRRLGDGILNASPLSVLPFPSMGVCVQSGVELPKDMTAGH